MKTDVIPPIPVCEWQYRGLFGYVKRVWVLPSVKIALATPARERASKRLAERRSK